MSYSEEFLMLAEQLIEAGRHIDARGWVPATSGNFSARLDDGSIAITVSGRHKGRLTLADIMLIDAQGHPLDGKKPSAETLLHLELYRHFGEAYCILHPHPINATVIARLHPEGVVLKNYELLKALDGIFTHESRITVPVLGNDQNMERLAQQLNDCLTRTDPVYAFIIDGHGLYTWGRSVEDTLRHLEALDYLFDCELRLHRMKLS
jgi:methylthioribulose-1-phosphate dehydratase